MFRVAIAEDEKEQADRLSMYIGRFCKENGLDCDVTVFPDGEQLLDHYKPVWDLILMDIEMPRLDGMRAAQRIRETDPETCLIFVTQMARYAIRGYEVGALDFVLKPVQYAAFAMKLQKAVHMLKKREKRYVLINTSSMAVKLAVDDILYVEVQNHKMAVHTADAVYYQSGTLKEMEAQLEGAPFTRCNSGFLVNLRNISSIEKEDCVMTNGERLIVSRTRKKEFLQSFAEYIGGSFR